MSELSREEALYACMFKIMLWWRAKDVNGNEWEEAIAEGKRFSANLPPEIRTALAGGGGGEKPCDAGLCERHGCKVYSGPPDCPTCGAPVCCQFCCYEAGLESRLAAAEKRAEEARDAFTLVVGECDALKAELAEAKKRLDDAGMANARADAHAEDIAWYLARFNDLRRALELPPGVGLTRQDMYLDLFNGIRQEMRIRREFMAERDAALARVKELEDAMGRIHDVWMATDVNALNLALANMDIPTRVTT